MKKFKNRQQFKEALRVGKFDLISIGLKSSYYKIMMEVLDVAKELGMLTMVGGIHAAAAPQELLDNEKIDYVFHGESEITFPQFIENPQSFSREIFGEKPQVLDDLPFIDRDQFRERWEHACNWLGHKTMTTVIASRGCPYKCAFCQPVSNIHFGKKLRRRSVDNVIAELAIIKKRDNPDFLMIHDDTFLIQPNWLEEFVEKYPKIGIPFWASGRADGICKNSGLVKKLVNVGWSLVSVGFESGSQQILDMIKKGTTVEQNLEAARIIKSTGAVVYGNYIMGFPTETRAEVMMTAKMCDEIGAEMSSWAFFSPYPGCELGEECIKHKVSLLDTDSYDRYPRNSKLKGVDYDYLNKVLGGYRE